MRLVNTEKEHYELIRLLRNRPEVQGGFIEPKPITEPMQNAYMATHAKNYRVCLNKKDEFVGYIGHVDGDIRVCVEPYHQGQGYATFMIAEFTDQFTGLQAKIKIANTASLNAFLNNGYEFKYYILEPKQNNDT